MFLGGNAVRALLTVTVAAVALAAPGLAPASIVNFTTPCVTHDWTVPSGVTSISVEAWGAQGEDGLFAGGLGGHATATVSVTPGETLHVIVGAQGTPTAAGCNGGGTGAASGGGASDVRQGGTALANRIVVAGGGGGGGETGAGGTGGGTTGGNGGGPFGGTGGTQATGGVPGGTLGSGGSGGSDSGGGGGGLYGGGGGVGGSAGGGGSGYVPVGGMLENGIQAGNGLVRFTWQAPTAVTFRSVTAKRTAHGVVVHWRTASETQAIGFRVYRQVRGARVEITHGLRPARNMLTGSSYAYVDRKAPDAGTVRYWIRAVSSDGSSYWYGPARAAP